MGGEAGAGKAEDTGRRDREERGVRVAEGGKEQHMERKEKVESVLSDDQEHSDGVLRQNVPIKKRSLKNKNM